MGAVQNNKPARKGKRSAKRRRNSTRAEWTTATPAFIHALIVAVAKFDGAIRFGRSRDGGAYAIGVYGDGEPWTDYLPGSKSVDDWLEELIEELED